ncbi:MAG: YggS family pyridoxal phosphate-dependent enzyme, partial [Nitrospirae bacterium]
MERVDRAANRSGRKGKDVKIIAATKTVGVEKMKEAVEAGINIIGENRVQEARAKKTVFLESGISGISWHLIGHLQRNKVKTAVQLFDLIHSVD